MIMQVTSRGTILPDFEMAEAMAYVPPRTPATGFLAECRAVAAKHATGRTTGNVVRFSDDQKCIHQMTRCARASRSW